MNEKKKERRGEEEQHSRGREEVPVCSPLAKRNKAATWPQFLLRPSPNSVLHFGEIPIGLVSGKENTKINSKNQERERERERR